MKNVEVMRYMDGLLKDTCQLLLNYYIIQRDPERQFNLHLDLKDIQLSSEELEELGLSI